MHLLKIKFTKNILIFFTVFILAFSGCERDRDYRIIRLAHGLSPTTPVHISMEFMAKRLEELSEGKIKIYIYPSQELGSERENLELIQIGSLGMTKVSASVLEVFVPSFRVFSLPFIFENDEQRFEFLDSPEGKKMLINTEEYLFRGLCYYDAGTRSFYTINKPIYTPSDLKGLKIRVQESATSLRMVRALGGSPTPISWGELYTALQQGVVDGAENNPPSFYLSRHYEVCKYYILNEHTAVPDVLVISTTLWNDLNEQEKVWVQQAADESAEYEKELWREASLEALQKVEEAGVTIIRPDKAPFIEQVQPLLEEFRKDPQIDFILKEIEKIK
jgi:tripartite ATP-independent transporter DctP family solute receptor